MKNNYCITKIRSYIKLLYRAYLRASDHPVKLRILRWFESIFFPSEGEIFEVDSNILLYLHPSDHLEYRLLLNGEYEPITLKFLEHNLSPGQSALFAGVNNGLHLIFASRCVSNDGCIIGVEPQPRSLYRAYKNIMLNELPPNIKLVSGAIGSKSAIVPMSDPPQENSGWASFVLRPQGLLPFYIQVESVPTLLDLLEIQNLDLMLLDVEGYELEVLQGLSLNARPKILIIEVHPIVLDIMKISPLEVYEILKNLGYSCWTLDGKSVYEVKDILENNVVAVLENININFVKTSG